MISFILWEIKYMKIVIADDSSLIRERIKSMLNDINNVFVVGEAKNGKEAFDLIRKKEADFAILDIRMPEMNGIEVLKKIRESKLKTKVCILTNYPYPQYKKKCIEAGTDYFLSKSEEFEDIKIIISEFVNNQRGG